MPSIINRAVCFVTRTDTAIVLNGDQSLFPRDGHELMRVLAGMCFAQVPGQS